MNLKGWDNEPAARRPEDPRGLPGIVRFGRDADNAVPCKAGGAGLGTPQDSTPGIGT